MSNYSDNKKAIEQFRKELKSMLGDISDIDVRCLNKAVNIGLGDVKRNTPVDTGFMRKRWHTTPAIKSKDGVTKSLANPADYASYVNDGHRIVDKTGRTTGFVDGQFMLEGAIHKVDKSLKREFEKEVERVNRKHDK
ncbi:MAG: HK97 gp10 family phage protein [Clostridia bacterium]|nr:HK97 gp10 family phage protein [Clostridia bacterium]